MGYYKFSLSSIAVIILLILLLGDSRELNAQFYFEKRTGISVEESLPEWVKLMYQKDADPGEVTRLYDTYYKTENFVKNNHTQYYKRWIRDLNRAYIPNPYDAEYIRKSKNLKVARNNIDWQCLGPQDWDHSAAGRSYAPGSAHVYIVNQSISNPDVLYAGTATAGIWKSTNHGENWQPISLDFLTKSITALAIDHSNSNIVYAELNNSIYKTLNGGQNWSPTGNATFQNLNLIVHDISVKPNNSDIIFAATNNGLYRSTNGGTDWTQVISGDVLELEYHPVDRDTLYISRKNGDATEFFRSLNGGTDFTLMNTGWPTPPTGGHQRRTEIAVSANAPNKVFALLTGSANGGEGLYGVYISNDLGQTWTFQCCGPQPAGPPSSTNPNLMGWSDQGLDDGGQYYYDLALEINPNNSNHILVGGVNLWVSTNGGNSFTCPAAWSHPHKPNYVHADIHDIRYYQHTNEIWIAGDGGIFLSQDGGANYHRKVLGIQGTDFWGFGQGHWYGDVMLGGAYHNGTMLKEDSVYINDWLCTDGGDGTLGFVNPGFDRQVYSWFDIKHLQGNRNIAPITRNFQHKPNNSYITGRSNDMCFHPYYYGTWYSGSGNALMKTEDNGYTYTKISELAEDLASMDICRSNPDYIYVCTWPDWWGEKKIFRSSNGGYTWTNITPPPSLISSNRWIPYQIKVHESNPLKIWIVRTSMYSNSNVNGQMVYTSDNGGMTWTNISGTGMNGETPSSIAYQINSNGGIYIGTRKAVYYKDNFMSNWELINSGLPLATASTKLVPYYRKSTIRNATDRSVWERKLVQTSAPKAYISVEKKNYFCLKDTVKFVDYSVVTDDNVVWEWHFPGAIQEFSSERAPKVTYNQPGTFDVTLKVSDSNGSDSITIYGLVKIDNQCDVDGFPGKALELQGNNAFAQSSGSPIMSNTITITAWIKPNGTQPEYAGIIINDNGDAAGLNFRANNTLAYHWPGGQWWWNSNLVVPQNQWSHIALVASPTSVKLYLNGIESVQNVNISPANFGAFKIGSYRGWAARNFNGVIDEVCIYNRSLSRDEIRELRHLTKIPLNDPSLINYYQFNEDGTLVYDKAGANNATLVGNSEKIKSSAPVGKGVSSRKNIVTNGLTDFDDTGFKVWFSNNGQVPSGEMVVSKLQNYPDTVQFDFPNFDGGYWIVNNYSNNSTFNHPDSIGFGFTGYISHTLEPETSLLSLCVRPENGEGPYWVIRHNDNQRLHSGMKGTAIFLSPFKMTKFEQMVLLRSPYPSASPSIWLSTESNSVAALEGGSAISLYVDHQHSKGMAIPHVNSTSMDSLGAPINGMWAFHSDLKRIIVFQNGQWKTIKSIALAETNFNMPTSEPKFYLSGSTSESAVLGFDVEGFIQSKSLTETQLLNIPYGLKGMIFYDSINHVLKLYEGHQWKTIQTEITNLNTSLSAPVKVDGINFTSDIYHPNAAVYLDGVNRLPQLPSLPYIDIKSPTPGLVCFDTQLNTLVFFDGNNWRKIILE